MEPTTIRVRFRRAGGHTDVTFWTGVPEHTFACVGTLTMSFDDARLFEAIIDSDRRFETIEPLQREEEWNDDHYGPAARYEESGR